MAVRKLIYWVEAEVNGKKAQGVASQFAMFQWFDKRSGANEAQFLDAIEKTARDAVSTVQRDYSGKPYTPFATGFERADMFRGKAKEYDSVPLGTQMVGALEEMAILDAVSRALGKNAVDFLMENDCFDLRNMDNDLNGVSKNEIFNSKAPENLSFRHTVGLKDHIFDSDRTEVTERSLESIIRIHGIKEFKVKVNSNTDENIVRLIKMAELFKRDIGDNYVFTLDGNEAFTKWDDLIKFVERFKNTPQLATLARNTKYLEQPFHRDLLKNIDREGREAIIKLNQMFGIKVLIDESGDEHDSYRLAIENGIYGGGYKTCKGILKAMRDRAIAVSYTQNRSLVNYFNSPEDLTLREPTDFPAALSFFSRLKASVNPEFNGIFNTKCGISTEEEMRQAERTMPGLYVVENGELKLILNGNSYPTKDVLGPGLGGPEVCFDPMADVPELRRKIHLVS
jgi:L-alanine-DL-glutamate epimerase-like enolase superfamily enzyme